MELQKITKEEFEQAKGKQGLKPKNAFWLIIRELEVDYGIKIWRKDWNRKTDPGALVNSNLRKDRTDKKFTIKTLENNEGWLVLRIK